MNGTAVLGGFGSRATATIQRSDFEVRALCCLVMVGDTLSPIAFRSSHFPGL